MFEIDKLPQSIDIGFTGEHWFRTIQIDMTNWMRKMPNGVPSIVYIRPGEKVSDAYVVETSFVDYILTWEISMSDLGAKEGTGIAQVWLEDVNGLTVNHRGKSATFTTIVHESAGEADAIPASQTDWNEQLALKVNKSDIANNLTTIDEGKALDARQGKALDEKKVDIHTLLLAGKFLQTDENGDAVWGEPATAEQVAAAATAWLDENVTQGETLVVDESLLVEGAAADAKIVGNKVSYLDNAMPEVKHTISNTNWASGTIKVSNGTNATSTTRIRTKSYYERINKVIPLTGYKISLYAYDLATGNYVGVWNGTSFVTASADANWTTVGWELAKFKNYKFRILLAKTDDSTITTDSYNNVYYVNNVDYDLVEPHVPAESKKVGDELGCVKRDLSKRSVIGLNYFGLEQPVKKYEYAGITIESSNGYITLNGTATTEYSVKVSNVLGTIDGGGTRTTWLDENIDLINGHTYRMMCLVESGSITVPEGGNGLIQPALRSSENTTIAYVRVSDANGAIYDGVYNSASFVAEVNGHSFVYFVIRNGVTYNNLKFRVLFCDETIVLNEEDIEHRAYYLDKIETDGYSDILSKYDTTTFGGVTVTKNSKAISNGNIIFDGAATQASRIKITNDLNGRNTSVNPSWLEERIPTIPGHTYNLYVMCVGGTYENSSSKGVQFTLRNSDNKTLSWVKAVWSKGTILTGNPFVADGTEAFVVTSIENGSIFTNLEFKIGLYDQTVSDATKTQVSDGLGDYNERELNSILAFTDDWHYKEITLTKGVYTNDDGDTTNYYVVTIPKYDSDGNIIPITADYDSSLSPMNHAAKNKTSVTANSGMGSGGGQGAVIHNGTVAYESTYTSPPSYLVYVGFDSDREITEYPSDTSSSTMIGDGIMNACIAYYRLVTNGVVRDVSDIGLPVTNLNPNPRMAIFTKSNGDVCFLACDGRYTTDAGLLPSELGALMVSLGAVDGWNLDGGGSTSLSVNGVKQNKHIDNNGTTDRNIHVTWNVPGIIPDYILPECDKTEDSTYKLICTISNGEKEYKWVPN